MEFALSWDLLVIIFTGVVIAYGFIVGKDETMKIIIATYIALITLHGLSIVTETLGGEITQISDRLGMNGDISFIPTIKLFFLAILILLLTIRGGFDVTATRETGMAISIVITGVLGFSAALLLLMAVMTTIAGTMPLTNDLILSPVLRPLMEESALLRFLISQQQAIFSLPAFLLLVSGFFGE